MKNTAIKIQPLSAHTGAEISGVDLSEELSEQACLEISEAFNTWGVIFFRGQTLTPGQQRDFARRFGEVKVSPHASNMQCVDPAYPEIKEVIRRPEDTRNIGGFWHMDLSFRAQPCIASVLYAKELPPYGGDTMFAHLGAAHDALSPGLQATLETLSTVHVRANSYGIEAPASGVSPEFFADMREKYAGVEATHPVIGRHPGSGRKVLYFSPMYSDRFDGWTREDSLPLMKHLTQLATRPEHACRFRWEEGSLAMWDNRAVLHYALDDYPGHRRLMHRVTIDGPWLEPCAGTA